jgi:hypothetical protein
MQERLDIVYDDYLYETSCSFKNLTTGTVVATSSFNGCLESQCLGLVSGDEHLHMIHDSVTDCMCFGSGDRFSALCATVGD